MSERALGFVEEWISENIHADAVSVGGDEAQARAYANQCINAAQAQDIPAFEIQEAIEDLNAFMAAAIVEANERAHGEAADDDAAGDDAVADVADAIESDDGTGGKGGPDGAPA